MFRFIRYFFLLVFFWLGVFLVSRVVFYLAVAPLMGGIDSGPVFLSFLHSLRLDLSVVAYFSAIPVIACGLYLFTHSPAFLKFCNGWMYGLIILYNLIAAGEACLYREWKAKLNIQAILHFNNPAEVFSTASAGLTLLFFIWVVAGSWLFIFIYRKWFRLSSAFAESETGIVRRWSYGFVFLVVFSGFAATGIRGGWQPIPIQESDAYFSDKQLINDASVNPFWSLVHNFLDYRKHLRENPFKVMEEAEAKKVVEELFGTQPDSTEIFLTQPRPNIVLILLEGWSAHCIRAFGGDHFAPFTDSLSGEGISFTRFYPAGYVSDQGVPAVLSSYPAVPRISVCNQPSKATKLSCLSRDLKEAGYASGFYFGGDLNYGNIKSYLFNKSFDEIRGEDGFKGDYPRGRLGIHDEAMARELLAGIGKAQQPFFYCWFTVSTHMPYDFPGEKRRMVNHKENDYINSISYADRVLSDFFSNARKQPWYQNTLFVLVSDHGHGCHKDFDVFDKEYHRIPLLFFGEVIRPAFRGRVVSSVFSQLDIAPTLLNQVGLDTKGYPWGKDMFNPATPHFAFFCNYSGSGLITDSGFVSFHRQVAGPVKTDVSDTLRLAALIRRGRAFQQAAYEDFMKR